VGIYYASGASGTVNEVTTRNHFNGICSIGILAENGTSTSESVTILNSSVHHVDGYGILLASSETGPPTLIITVKGNTVDSSSEGIVPLATAGSVTGNVVRGGSVGLDLLAPATTVSGNTVTDSFIGIVAGDNGVSATSNKISNGTYGILIVANGTTFQSNTITRVDFGVRFSCRPATVTHNTINDVVSVGLDRVPAGFGSPNKFFNVNTIRTDGCAARSAHSAVHAGRLPGQAISR